MLDQLRPGWTGESSVRDSGVNGYHFRSVGSDSYGPGLGSHRLLLHTPRVAAALALWSPKIAKEELQPPPPLLNHGCCQLKSWPPAWYSSAMPRKFAALCLCGHTKSIHRATASKRR